MTEREYFPAAELLAGDDLVEQIAVVGEQAVQHPWFDLFARSGYAAKGVVYLLAGSLSALAAIGLRHKAASSVNALEEVFTGSFGYVALLAMAVGLAGYALLRLAQALFDLERKGSGLKGLIIRAAFVGSAIFYAGLAFATLRLAFGGGGVPDGQEEGWVAWAFGLPFGNWAIGIIGAIVIGVGVWQGYLAYRARFNERFCWDTMSTGEQRWTTWIGRVGLVARGIVITLIGGFLVEAALLVDASKVEDSAEAVQSLAGPFGWWAVAIVAAGLVAYGMYLFAAARYCKIAPE